MTRDETLKRMVAPGTKRRGKWMLGVIQVWVTRACDNSCFGCTQGSNLGGPPGMITVDQFRAALRSLKGYFGVVGMFGGNPALHPRFEALCEVMKEEVPDRRQRGLWCNNPVSEKNARTMRHTFDPRHSNLNVHLSREAYDMFKRGWPECAPVGLETDSRHSPVHLAMRDLIPDEGERWALISNCDINQHWSAMIGVFRGELRAWFCEVAGAQAMLRQHDPSYPDTGMGVYEESGDPHSIEGQKVAWWKLPMWAFERQVEQHCHSCGVPLRGYGELAMSGTGTEQTTESYKDVFVPKRTGREVEVVTSLEQLGTGRISKVVSYIENAKV